MTYLKTLFLFALLTLMLNAFGQENNDRVILGRLFAEQQLRGALSGTDGVNYIDNKRLIIKDSVTAVGVAEPILFGIYKADEIIKERPYKVYLIDNYWVIGGMLRERLKGGTFLIIIDARDGRVLRIRHWKEGHLISR